MINKAQVQKRFGVIALWFLVVAYLYYLRPLFLVDFWYDEVMSLEEFILVPFKKTVTDYPVPNNHIFFSLLMNGWLKLWGIHTFAEAVQSIWIVRLLPALFSAGALFAVAATVNRVTKQQWGMMGMIALMCMLPFYNYATQVRGYGLSILLITLIANRLVAYYQARKTLWGVLAGFFTALFIYTIPSNLYPVIAFLAVAGTMCLWIAGSQGFKQAIGSVHAKALLLVGSGVVLAIVLYLPVLKQVISNDYVKSAGMFRAEIWSEALKVLKYLLKPYYIALILILWGLWFAITTKADFRIIVVLVVVILLPFVFSYVRGDKPFDRVFLWISPLLAISTGVLYTYLYEGFIKRSMIATSFHFVVTLGFIWGLQDAKKNSQLRLADDLKNEVNRCDIYYNNLLTTYHTNQNLGWFKQNYYTDNAAVYLHEVDKYAMHGYLPLHAIQWEPDPQKIKSADRYFIITLAPVKAQNYYLQFDSNYSFKRLNPDLDYVNIVEAKRVTD